MPPNIPPCVRIVQQPVARFGLRGVGYMVVMLLDEDFDVRSQVPEIFVPVRANLFALQVSMKLSQLASSYGFAGRLMLGIIRPRSRYHLVKLTCMLTYPPKLSEQSYAETRCPVPKEIRRRWCRPQTLELPGGKLWASSKMHAMMGCAVSRDRRLRALYPRHGRGHGDSDSLPGRTTYAVACRARAVGWRSTRISRPTAT